MSTTPIVAKALAASSRIESVEVSQIAWPLQRPFRSGIHDISHIFNVVVELESNGSTGVGYSFAFYRADSDAVLALTLELANSVLGGQPCDVRSHWARMWSRLNFIGHEGPPVMALASVDTALWDLHARTAGLPLHALLGANRQSSPVYASGGSLALTIDELVDEALSSKRAGYSAFKCRVGSADLASDVQRIGAVRHALGDSHGLMVDANQAWSRIQARRACDALSDLDLGWIEEPIDAEDIAGLAELRAAVDVPIAAGETAYGLRGIGQLLRQEAVDIIQPDLMRCGGITPMLSAVSLAAAHQTAVMPHLYTETSAHLMGLLSPGAMIEYLPGWFDHLFGPPPIDHGFLEPRDSPGLGLDLDKERLEAVTITSTRRA